PGGLGLSGTWPPPGCRRAGGSCRAIRPSHDLGCHQERLQAECQYHCTATACEILGENARHALPDVWPAGEFRGGSVNPARCKANWHNCAVAAALAAAQKRTRRTCTSLLLKRKERQKKLPMSAI